MLPIDELKTTQDALAPELRARILALGEPAIPDLIIHGRGSFWGPDFAEMREAYESLGGRLSDALVEKASAIAEAWRRRGEPRTVTRRSVKVGRNDPCSCRSPTRQDLRAAVARCAHARSLSSRPLTGLLPVWELLPSSGRLRGRRALRVFNRSTLESFWRAYPDAEASLRAWFDEVEKASWRGPEEIRARYGSADFLANNRVIFNIRGNRYRLVVAVKYDFFCVYIRFLGTHAAYDEIDAATV